MTTSFSYVPNVPISRRFRRSAASGGWAVISDTVHFSETFLQLSVVHWSAYASL
jgi:hypothetical protein